VTLAHVGGIPIEETIGMYGPALVLAAGAACASVGARLRRLSRRRRTATHRDQGAVQ
jgi:hypothetical protein